MDYQLTEKEREKLTGLVYRYGTGIIPPAIDKMIEQREKQG